MLNTLLTLLGSMLILVTALIAVLFMIAGLRRSLEDVKELVASGIIGLVMVALGVLPWEIAIIVGTVALAVGGLALFFFILLPSYRKGEFRGALNVRAYISREYVKLVLQFLVRMLAVIGVVLLCDAIGLSVFLLSRGQWNLLSFKDLLTILLLLEGSLIGAVGGFMFVGYSEQRVAGQAAINPAIARDQIDGWRERRLSQQKWGVAMLIAAAILIFLGLLVSFLTSL
jgi:hypothetical protein